MKYNLMQHDWLNGVVIPGLKHSDKRNQLTIHRMTVTGPYNARSSQSIKIAIDLSIDKSMKIGKSDLTDIYRIDQSVEIDDTLLWFIDLSRFYRFHRFYLKIHLFFCSVSSKMKTDFMQTVNLLTMELQLKVEGSDNLLSL